MKNKLNILVLSAAAIALSSCASSFLDRDPQGNTILQNQYEQLDNTVEGSVRGIYSLLYEFSDHDQFGKRSIDLYTDLLSGDMALTSYSYGWFYSDEQGMTSTGRTGYIWSQYYLMLRNINKTVALVKTQSDIVARVAEHGLPQDGSLKQDKNGDFTYKAEDGDTIAVTQNEVDVLGYYAQLMALRGYLYANLAQLYFPTPKQMGESASEIKFVPIYTEDNLDSPQPLATCVEVSTQAHSDLETAIAYFDAFDEYLMRETKLRIDGSVARGILAYSYLNSANSDRIDSEVNKNAYARAAQLADEVITSGQYQMLQSRELLTTGFNDLSHSSWMWGQDVTVETASGLGSWFGQVDIHSYSYAWAGDTKVIDEILYNEVIVGKYPWDNRVNWFRSKEDKNFPLCPDGKFFSAKCPTSTKQDDIDREWLSDNVFMRIEAMYLIAAEAQYRLGNDALAINYLTAITDERVKPNDAEATAAYDSFKSGLNHSNLLDAIYDNWRIEMWGEGYALQTFRRLGVEKTRGGNHASDAGSKVQPTDPKYTFQVPSSESTYNPNVE